MMYKPMLFAYRQGLLGGRLKQINTHLVPKEGPMLVVSNHTSPWDPAAGSDIFPYSRTVHWVAKERLYDWRAELTCRLEEGEGPLKARVMSILTSLVVNNSHTIPANKDAFNTCVSWLRLGEIVGIFPYEGFEFNSDGMIPSFVYIARKAKVGILAVHVDHVDSRAVRVKKYYPYEYFKDFRTKPEVRAFAEEVMG